MTRQRGLLKTSHPWVFNCYQSPPYYHAAKPFLLTYHSSPPLLLPKNLSWYITLQIPIAILQSNFSVKPSDQKRQEDYFRGAGGSWFCWRVRGLLYVAAIPFQTLSLSYVLHPRHKIIVLPLIPNFRAATSKEPEPTSKQAPASQLSIFPASTIVSKGKVVRLTRWLT